MLCVDFPHGVRLIPPECLEGVKTEFCLDKFTAKFGGQRMRAVCKALREKGAFGEGLVLVDDKDPTGVKQLATIFKQKEAPFFVQREDGTHQLGEYSVFEEQVLNTVVQEAMKGRIADQGQVDESFNQGAKLLVQLAREGKTTLQNAVHSVAAVATAAATNAAAAEEEPEEEPIDATAVEVQLSPLNLSTKVESGPGSFKNCLN